MQLIRKVFISGLLVAQFSACGDPDSPEQQILGVIEKMEVAAESRDVGELVDLVSPHYRDAYANDREEVAQRIRGYFVLNQSIHLLTRIQDVSFSSADEARATVLVGMVGRDADAANAWQLAAELYEFDIALLRENGEWQVSWAEWRRK